MEAAQEKMRPGVAVKEANQAVIDFYKKALVLPGPGGLQHVPQGLDGHVAGPADALDLLRLLDGAQGGQQGQNIFDCQGGVPRRR